MNGTERNGKPYLDPAVPISRAEAIAVIGRLLSSMPERQGRTVPAASFRDAELIPTWASEYAAKLASLGVIDGYPDGTLRPDAEITREEAAAMVAKLLDSMEP